MVNDDSKQLVARGYDRIAHRYLEAAQHGLTQEQSTARMNYLRTLLERLPDQAQVLELGCGAGVPCTQLLVKRAQVTGVDISAAQQVRPPLADEIGSDFS